MENNTSREMLLKRIQVCSFVLTDTNLFLDTHPDCQMALEYFEKHHNMLCEAQREYVEKYGPLTAADYNGGGRWNWVDSPWPWEMGVKK